MFQTKFCRENQNIHFTLNNIFPKIPAVYETIWKNKSQPIRPQMTI